MQSMRHLFPCCSSVYKETGFAHKRLNVLIRSKSKGQQCSTNAHYDDYNRKGAKVENVSKKKKKIKQRLRSVYAWGLIHSGALGIPPLINNHINAKSETMADKGLMLPVRVKGVDKMSITMAAAGYGFSLLANANNKLIGMGLNINGQLGFHAPLKNDSTGLQRLIEPRRIVLPASSSNNRGDIAKIVSVAAGRLHSLIATENRVYALGSNSLGQCGRLIIQNEDYSKRMHIEAVQFPDTGLDFKQVACGYDTSFALTTKGRLYAFGLGADGQLGDGTLTNTRWKPQRVLGQIEDVKISKIAVCADTILALSESGEVFGWGQSEYGQLAMICDGLAQTSTPTFLPFKEWFRDIAVTGSSCAVLSKSGQVYVWGYGLLGLGPNVFTESEPQPLPRPLFGHSAASDVSVTAIFGGTAHMAAINSRNQLYMWGQNRYGILGLGDKLEQIGFPLHVCLPADVLSVSLAPDHTICLTA